jgi:hypothetical protein
MLRQTFTSEPFLYRLPSDIPGYPSAIYHPELTVPPRIYGEEWDTGPTALFVNEEVSVDGYEVIYLWLVNNQQPWPSYNMRLHRWNATTGVYLGSLDAGFATPYLRNLSQSIDGTLWQLYDVTTLWKVQIDPVAGLSIGATPDYDLSTIGLTGLLAFSVDVEQNLLLGGRGFPQDSLFVYNLTTGATIRTIQLPGIITKIMPEDSNRCYVSCANLQNERRVCLVNYATGELQAVFKVQDTYNQFSIQQTITWDRKYRRFLVWNNAPLTTDGQNTSVVKGYFPQPQPVGLTAPIPLRPPRKYRSTPILTRVYGDIGESMPGARVTLTPGSGIATVSGFPGLTDSDGESVGTIYNADAGSLTLTASTTV